MIDATRRTQLRSSQVKPISNAPKPLKSSDNVLYNRFSEEFDYEINVLRLDEPKVLNLSQLTTVMKNTGFIL